DVDFFDAADLASIASITMPAGANRVQLDAFVDGAWILGTPAAPSAAISAFHALDLSQVRGIRVTYTSNDTFNDGYVLTPGAAAACEGRITFRVVARGRLVSDPSQRPEGSITDTVTGD